GGVWGDPAGGGLVQRRVPGPGPPSGARRAFNDSPGQAGCTGCIGLDRELSVRREPGPIRASFLRLSLLITDRRSLRALLPRPRTSTGALRTWLKDSG